MMEALTAAFQKALPFFVALALVQCVLLTLRGQSVGKLLAGSRIVRNADNAKAGFLRAVLLRGTIPLLIAQIPIAGGLFWLVDVCFIFGEERRCVHDYIAGTKVVRANAPSPRGAGSAMWAPGTRTGRSSLTGVCDMSTPWCEGPDRGRDSSERSQTRTTVGTCSPMRCAQRRRSDDVRRKAHDER